MRRSDISDWYLDGNDGTTIRTVCLRERCPVTITKGETIARGAQSYSILAHRTKPRPIISNSHAKSRATTLGGDIDPPRFHPRGDPMTNGILDERLQQEHRHAEIEQRMGGVDRDDQSFAKTHFLNRKVLP
jgi:hypothetical protein